jgi:hypothetical protein
MKKTKKLVLAKETLRDLEEPTRSKVAGGYTLTDCNPCSYDVSCPVYCVDMPITYTC